MTAPQAQARVAACLKGARKAKAQAGA